MLELEAAGDDAAKTEIAARRLLFVTGGSGITPIAAMLRSLAARNAMPDVVHVHYARTAEDVIFGEELRCLAVDHPSYRLIEIHTARDPRRFDEDGLAARVPDWRTREAWACGPQSLLVAIESVYASQPHVGQGDRSIDAQPHVGQGDRSVVGQPHVRPVLHVERFRAALAVLPANASGGRVRFAAAAAKDGTTVFDVATTGVEADGDATTPLLHVAERAGLAPRSGCRMGICHTCDSTLVSGCVRDLRTDYEARNPYRADRRPSQCPAHSKAARQLVLRSYEGRSDPEGGQGQSRYQPVPVDPVMHQGCYKSTT